MIQFGTLAYSLHKLKRELFMFVENFSDLSAETEARTKVVIPPLIASYMHRGQYLLFFLLLLYFEANPYIQSCTVVKTWVWGAYC